MKTPRMIEIAGGGIAGLSLGIGLRQREVPVRVFESGRYPRHRVCGEFIAGEGEFHLRRIGIRLPRERFPCHRSTRWFRPGANAVTLALPRDAPGVSRYFLDAALAERFTELGGDLVTDHRVRHAAFDGPGRVWCGGRRPHALSPWIGLKVHVSETLPDQTLEVHLGDGSYVGISAIEDGRVNLCGLFRRRAGSAPRNRKSLLADCLRSAGLKELAHRLEEASVEENSFAAVAGIAFNTVDWPRDRLHLGDGMTVIPPFTGDGMSLALESAACALDPLEAYARGQSDWETSLATARNLLHGRFQRRLRWANRLHPLLLRPAGQRTLLFAARLRLLPFHALHRRTHGQQSTR